MAEVTEADGKRVVGKIGNMLEVGLIHSGT